MYLPGGNVIGVLTTAFDTTYALDANEYIKKTTTKIS